MNERIIVGIKCGMKANPTCGMVAALAEEIDGELLPITEENFCSTKQIFIVGGYDEIEAKFKENELFRIRVEINQTPSGPSTYKSWGSSAQKLQPNDVAEIINAELPDRNIRRLSIIKFPITRYILIQNNFGECYGPFDWIDKSQSPDNLEIELKIITGGRLGKSVGEKNQICRISTAKIKSGVVFTDSLFGRKSFIYNISSFIPGATLEEYSNDLEIIEDIKKLAADSVGRTIDRKNLEVLSILAGKTRQGNYPANKNKILLFNKIVSSNLDILGDLNEWFGSYLKNQAGVKIIEDYIQKNSEKYIDRLKADKEIEINNSIKSRQDELDQIKKNIDFFTKERTRLSDELESKRKDPEKDALANKKASLEELSKESQAKIAAMNIEEEAANKRLDEILERISKYGEVDNVDAMVNKSQGRLDYLNSLVENKTKELSALTEESRKEEGDIRKKLRGMKPYVDHLNGSFTGEEFKQQDIKVACVDFSYKENIHAQRSIIESVKTRLAQLGRSLDDQDVANLLISKQQSFITFFAGLPGVGKTSLCKLMAQAEGVEKRLLSVSVARGWTSMKDMIGFHNPLNDKFQPASTGMYEFLHAINEETKEIKATAPSPMSYILLDEANLSSIEHYWSAFMGVTDATTSQNMIIGQNSLVIPRNLRFLATINYDGTTEPLSPRILDRAGVIVMRPGEISSRQCIDETALQALPISSDHMHTLFGIFEEAPELENREKSALEAIGDILSNSTADKGRSIYISQRKINAIRQYCGRARSIMRSDGKDVTALDWAVMQHILPQVNGHGIKFGNRLLALKKCFEDYDLEKSTGYLDQMILAGQNDLHSYEFFCW